MQTTKYIEEGDNEDPGEAAVQDNELTRTQHSGAARQQGRGEVEALSNVWDHLQLKCTFAAKQN